MRKDFTITANDMENIAANFSKAMTEGLKERPSSLKMLPSFIKTPTGREKGDFLAVDFGGSNVRILKINLGGQRGFEFLDKRSFALKDPLGSYDYTSSKTTADSLFDFIARQVKEIAQGINGTVPLGFTFSFPCHQRSITEAVLIRWTKELETTGAQGRDAGQMLKGALKRNGIENIFLKAIINDTAATLLTAAYLKPGADIASICGTGHNTCYLEPKHPLTGRPMIVNMESGNFAEIPQTAYDRELDKNSENPGAQLLEKLCGGHYLGEILRLALNDVLGCALPPYSLKGEDLALLAAGGNLPKGETAGTLAAKLGLGSLPQHKVEFISQTAIMIIKRSARLIAATFAGTLKILDPALANSHIIAIDGSLYEKMPGYSLFVKEALNELLREKSGKVALELVKDGSASGAAIAAATAEFTN